MQEDVSERLDRAVLPEEMAFESRPEEWEVEAVPKPGETFSRHREEKEQSLKSWGKPWPIQKTERRSEALEPNKQLRK